VTSRKNSTVSKILSYQLLIILIITAGLAGYGGMHYAISSALGGVAAFVPNLYFALCINKANGQPARKVMNAFYAGESGKLILTAVLFVLIFKVPNITIIPLLVGYIAALSIFWFALLMR
jgi:ATP synthase protein I